MNNSDAITSGVSHRFFTKGTNEWIDANGTHYAGADLDLTIGGTVGPCRDIVQLQDGILDLDTGAGAEKGLALLKGTSLSLKVKKVMGTSTCTIILVIW